MRPFQNGLLDRELPKPVPLQRVSPDRSDYYWQNRYVRTAIQRKKHVLQAPAARKSQVQSKNVLLPSMMLQQQLDDEIVYIQNPLEISTPQQVNESTEEGWNNNDITTELDGVNRSSNFNFSGRQKAKQKRNIRKILSSNVDATLMSQDLSQLQRMEGTPLYMNQSVEVKQKALSAIYRPLILMKDESRSATSQIPGNYPPRSAMRSISNQPSWQQPPNSMQGMNIGPFTPNQRPEITNDAFNTIQPQERMSTVDILIKEYSRKKPRIERKIFLSRQEQQVLHQLSNSKRHQKSPAAATKPASGATSKIGTAAKPEFKHMISERGQNYYFKHASNRDLRVVQKQQKPRPGTGAQDRIVSEDSRNLKSFKSSSREQERKSKSKRRKVRKPKRSPLKLDPIDCGEDRNSEGEIINIKAIFDQVNAGTQMSKVELHGDTQVTPLGIKKLEKVFEKVEKVDRSQSAKTYSSGHRYRKLPRTAMKKYEDLRIHEEILSEGPESPPLSQHNHGLSSQDTRALINRDIMKRERKKRSRSKRKKLSYVKSQPIENYMSDSFDTSPHKSQMKDNSQILHKGMHIVGRLRPSTSKRRNRMLNQPSFFKSKGLLYPVDSSSKQLTVLTHQKEYNGNDTIGWNEQRAFDYERELEEYRIQQRKQSQSPPRSIVIQSKLNPTNQMSIQELHPVMEKPFFQEVRKNFKEEMKSFDYSDKKVVLISGGCLSSSQPVIGGDIKQAVTQGVVEIAADVLSRQQPTSGILTKCRTQRLSQLRVIGEGGNSFPDIIEDQKRSVTFDLSQEEEGESKNKSASIPPSKKDEPLVLGEAVIGSKKKSVDILIQHHPSAFPSEVDEGDKSWLEKRTIGEKEQRDMLIRENTQTPQEAQDDFSMNATEGLDGNNIWRVHPSLQVLKGELVELKKNEAAQRASLQSAMTLQDWFNTRLYSKLFGFKILEFNHSCDQDMFLNLSEVSAALHDLSNPLDFNRYQNSDNESVEGLNPDSRKEKQEKWKKQKEGWSVRIGLYYSKGINTLRELLKEELGMQRLYNKLIQIHGKDYNLENTARLLIRCKLLLQGRRLLSQVLMVIIKRNDLVNELKHIISLDDQPTYSDLRSSLDSKKNESMASLTIPNQEAAVHPEHHAHQEAGDNTGRPEGEQGDAAENFGPTLIDVIEAEHCSEGESFDKTKKKGPQKRKVPPYIGQGDLGDFKFDEGRAQELGETIVNYSMVITELVKELVQVKGFPGLRSPQFEDPVFLFKGTNFMEYLKKETSEIKQMLFAYKIYV